MNKSLKAAAVAALLALPAFAAFAQATPAVAGPALPLLVGAAGGGANFSVPIQTLLFFTALSFLPAILLMMTGFTRIVIVLSLFRQAIGTQAAPPNQVITGLSLFLTFFVMSPDDRQGLHRRLGAVPGQPDQLHRCAREGPGADARVHAQADAPVRRAAVRQAGQAAGRHQGRRRAVQGAGAGLRRQRAEDRVPDRLPDLHPVPDHRHDRGQRADVAGHDDAVAGAGGAAVQADAVRAGRRLEPAAGLAGRELQLHRAVRRPFRPLAPAPRGQHDDIPISPGTASPWTPHKSSPSASKPSTRC